MGLYHSHHAITHTIYSQPLLAYHQHAHGYEEPINTDEDMYAVHICPKSLPWQQQLLWLPGAHSCSVMGSGYYEIAN